MMLVPILSLLFTRQVTSLSMFSRFDGPGHNVDETYVACESPSGELLFAGKQFTDPASKFDLFTQQMDSSGALKWRSSYGPVRRGGDHEYRYSWHLSERFWRSDIPDAMATDSEGNVYVAVSSTFDTSERAFKESRVMGEAVVSFDSLGRLRFVKKLIAGGASIAVSSKGVVIVAVVAQDLQREQQRGATEIYAFRTSDGGNIGKISLGNDCSPVALRALKDGTVSLVLAAEPWFDPTPYQYKPGGPAIRSSWRNYVIDSNLKVVIRHEFDQDSQRLRGKAAIDPDGRVFTIDGMPDGTDRLSCWVKGTHRWSTQLRSAKITYVDPADPKGVNYYLHDRRNAALTANSSTVFVGGAPTTSDGTQWQIGVESFNVADGRPMSLYLHSVAGSSRGFVLNCLYASENGLLAGGKIGDDATQWVDAWVGRWDIPRHE